jgi:hypothetical protein
MKLLGIGQINSLALLAIIGDVRRFERPEKLVAYIGLNPGQRESGRGKHVKLGGGKRGRGDLRCLLIQGTQAVLRTGRATPLGQWGWKLLARKGQRNIAVVAIARKLLVQVWHLLSGNPPVATEPAKSFATKLTKLAGAIGAELRPRSSRLSLPAPPPSRPHHVWKVGPQNPVLSAISGQISSLRNPSSLDLEARQTPAVPNGNPGGFPNGWVLDGGGGGGYSYRSYEKAWSIRTNPGRRNSPLVHRLYFGRGNGRL